MKAQISLQQQRTVSSGPRRHALQSTLMQQSITASNLPQQRNIVSSSLKKELGKIDPSLSSLPPAIPQFQPHGQCEFHAKDIVKALHEKNNAPDVERDTHEKNVTGEEPGLIEVFLQALMSSPLMKTDTMGSADELLDLYQKSGPFVLRGPKLDDPRQDSGYMHHAIAVVAAVKVRIEGKERIVFCALDCNDAGLDKETMDARKMAINLNKKLSEFEADEAQVSGSDNRRIRLIDADSVVRRLWNHTMDMRVRDFDMESEVCFQQKGTPILTQHQMDQLATLLENNWQEVEDYSDEDYSGLAHRQLQRKINVSAQ